MLTARREALLAGAGSLAVAAGMKAPALGQLGRAIPRDLGDPLLLSWALGWGAHALRARPWWPWDANAFWPESRSLAFSDSLYGYSPLGVLFGSGPRAALVRYSVLFVLAYALAAAGAYLLARQLGCRPVSAGVAAAAYAFAPWHLGQDGHLHVLSNGGVPLALALLARGHGIGTSCRAAPVRPLAAMVGWLVAAWQLTLGFAVGLQLAYLLGVLALIGVVLTLLGRWRTGDGRGGTLVLVDVVGAGLFVAVGAAFALPYLDVAAAHPEATRTVADLRLYSPPLRGFFVAPPESTLWGGLDADARAGLSFPPEMALDIGVVLPVLAVYGAVRGGWSRFRRLGLAAGAVGLLLLAAGTTVAGGRLFLLLFDHAPGWRSIRTPGRLVIVATLALALLAADGVDQLLRGVRRARVLGAALVGLVLLDGHGSLPRAMVPPPSPGLAAAANPVLVLPSTEIGDMQTMWASTAGFPRLVNGGSGFTPRLLADVRRQVASFPDRASVDYLRRLGVRSVVLRPALATGTPWAAADDRPLAGLGVIARAVAHDIVYDLAGGTS